MRCVIVVAALTLIGGCGMASSQSGTTGPQGGTGRVTGHALAGHSKVAFDAGCDAFITKPCLPERLLDEIRAIVTAQPRSGEPTP